MIICRFRAAIMRVGDHEVDEPTTAELMYDADKDPLSVTFRSLDESHVPWIFDRGVLAHGAQSTHPVGQGDVRIWRSLDGAHVTLCLTSDEGHADILMPHSAVHAFLAETFADVPLGEENIDAALDGILKEILG